jgi:Tfp pilus assembly protein PilX
MVNNRGSALISAVALAILMALTGAGFMLLTTNGLNNESALLQNDKAFQAAESGVWMGARWLRQPNSSFPSTNFPTSGAYYPLGGTTNSYVTLDNMFVFVTVTAQTVLTVPVASITAEVYSSSTKSAATFLKRITVSDIRVQSFGSYCTFFNTFQPDYSNYVAGQFKQFTTLGDWGGFRNRTFYGRFHMNNCYIKLYSDANAGGAGPVLFRNGLVTVATPTDAAVLTDYSKNYGTSAASGHDYDSGVWADWTTVNPTRLDSVFTDRYVANVDQISLPNATLNATAILNNPNVSNFNKIELPVSKDSGEAYNNYRPTLDFKTSNAMFQYRDNANNLRCTTFTSIDGKVFCCHNNLNVRGTVQGKVTVTTDAGTSILPVGNILVADYTTAGDSVPSSSTNIIGLAPGKHIRFNATWRKIFKDSGAVSPTAAIAAANDTLRINASIVATGSANVTYTTATGTTTKNEIGTEYWDLENPVNYSYKLYGNHILGGYRPVGSGYHTATGSSAGCMGTQKFTYDNRMTNANLQPPAYPNQQTVDGLWVLRIKGWSEGNTF